MAGRFSIWTDFRVGRKDTSKEVKALEKNLQSMDREASRAMDTFKGVLGAQVVGRGLQAAAAGAQDVTTQFVEFDQSITSAGARWGDAFNRGTEGFEQISAAARETGAVTEHTSAQAGSALNYMAMAGFNAAESVGLLPDIADLATSAQLDFARSSDIASDALGAFGMAEGTAEQKIAGFKKIVDQASKTANMSNQTLEMWFESIREGGPAFTAAGQKMSTYNAAVAALAGSGKKGATTGYMLTRVMKDLADPTKKAKRVMRELKIDIDDGKGGFKDFIDIVGEFERATANMGDVEKTKKLAAVFKRSANGMKILMKTGEDGLRSYANQIENSEGAAKKVADVMRTSLGGRIKKLQSAASELGFKIIEAFGPHVESGIKKIGAWLDDTNDNADGLKDTVAGIADGFGAVFKFIGENKDELKALLKMWLIFKGGKILGGGLLNGLGALSTAFGVVGKNAGIANQGVKILGGSLAGMQTMIGAVTTSLAAGLALGTALWDQLEANEKKAQDNANAAAGINKDITAKSLTAYTDEELAKLSGQAQTEVSKDWGWLDLNAEEHGDTKAAMQDLLRKVKAEQKGRGIVSATDTAEVVDFWRAQGEAMASAAEAAVIAKSARAMLDNEPLMTVPSYTTGNPTMDGGGVSRTESVERKEVIHKLRLEDNNKRARLTPADPGIQA